ncbi:MAG TPA: response regulator [Chitinophagaceae bacterium]|nr:response regulator [Chitinophagaceae bacterium]
MKKCILIYDDDADILGVCKIILENQNYRVETRMLCDNIIKDIRQVKPDLILMDLWIPGIGGENAIGLMKNNKATSHIPIFLFSANTEIEQISVRTNANGFLKKPFEVKAMLELIENNIPEIA